MGCSGLSKPNGMGVVLGQTGLQGFAAKFVRWQAFRGMGNGSMGA